MSETNVEIVKSLFAAWKDRNPQAALKHIDPDIEVDFTGMASGVGGARPVASGREELQGVLADWFEAWESLEWFPQNFIDAGDNVIVWLRLEARGRKSGAAVESNQAVVYTLKDGLIVAFRGYDTLAAATSAAGI